MDRFKVNDSVKVKGNSERSGEVGTVLSQALVGKGDLVSECYWVKFSDGTNELYEAANLELEPESQTRDRLQ